MARTKIPLGKRGIVMMGPYTNYIIAAFSITGLVFALNIMFCVIDQKRIKKTIKQIHYER